MILQVGVSDIVVPQNGWFIKWMIWGYPYFRKPLGREGKVVDWAIIQGRELHRRRCKVSWSNVLNENVRSDETQIDRNMSMLKKRRRFKRLRKVQDDFGRICGGVVVVFLLLFSALTIDLLKFFCLTLVGKSLFGRNLVLLVWDTWETKRQLAFGILSNYRGL